MNDNEHTNTSAPPARSAAAGAGTAPRTATQAAGTAGTTGEPRRAFRSGGRRDDRGGRRDESRRGEGGRRGDGRRGQGRRGRRGREENRDELLDRVVTINRVAKVHKGGRTFSFAALVVVGDGNGTVGVGYGKSHEVPAAIAKGQLDARKHMFTVPRIRGTVPHRVIGHDAAGTVLLRPAAPGTGVIAGGPVRAVLECAGISDILSKSMGSATAVNMVRATVAALKGLEEPEEIAARRGMSLEDVAPDAMLRARAAGLAQARKARDEAKAKADAGHRDGGK